MNKFEKHLNFGKIYDKRDGFDFDIVFFLFLDGDVPHRASYGVYISQLLDISCLTRDRDVYTIH